MRRGTAIILTAMMTILMTAYAHAGDPLTEMDRRAVDLIDGMRGPIMDGAMEGISELSNGEKIIAFSLLMCAYGDERAFKAGKLSSAAFALTGLQVFTLKRLVGRERPDASDDLSFPSGHASFAFSTATVMGHYYPRFRPAFYLAATLVAFSRVYLERHYPSDVLIGAMIGTANAVLILRVRDKVLELGW
jgi:undecaprenyl-diphosphatase